jgi:hypothetical protein
MLISKAKYHDDLSKAYIRGLEVGYELAIKLDKIARQKGNGSSYLPDKEFNEFSLLLRQLLDITEDKGIDLE